MVGDEADRADEDAGDAGGRERVELLEQVRAEPGLSGRARALVGERPALEPGSLGDQPRRLQQLILVRIARLENPRRAGCGP